MTIDYRRTTCRACGSFDLSSVLNLGPQPPANAFLKPDEFASEQSFPLEVFFCRSCTLLQLLHIVSPDLLFRNYVYVSSTSPVFRSHFEGFADQIMERYLKPGQRVVDIGSNDGILLAPLKARGASVLGVDPATDIAKRATQAGIPTLSHFFTPIVARVIKAKFGSAQVITANNVFAHTDDTNGFLAGVRELLIPDGVFIVEVAYLMNFLDQRLFDTVYHEHVAYYSVRSLEALVQTAGFHVVDVELVSSHGGSIRATIAMDGRTPKASVAEFLAKEQERGLDREETYHNFAGLIEQNKQELTDLLQKLRNDGKRIVGYGAPAKGNTLLNYMGIDHQMLDYIVDDSVFKQGLFTPGMHIPVAGFDRLAAHHPDYILILAWNFADAIIDKCRAIGSKFIIPVPTPTIQ